jgi:outer membrane protein OmpA-like peptidoglycan-associated protein
LPDATAQKNNLLFFLALFRLAKTCSMKKIYLLLFIIFTTLVLPNTSYSQDILKRVKNKAKQRADAKIDNTIDKGLDEAEGKNKKAKIEEAEVKQKPEVKQKTNTGAVTQNDTAPTTSGGTQLSYTSKYDFVQGDKIIAYEDFNATNLGDFPLRWNTNASAEVVTVAGLESKWLKIGEKGVFLPEFINSLPENFTFEFDLGVNNANYFSPFSLNIASLKKPEDFVDYAYLVSLRPEHAVHLEFAAANSSADGVSKLITGKAGVATISNSVNYKVWDVGKNQVAHISLWRQNQRLRVYLNGEKIWDSPRAFEAPTKYNAITFAFYGPYGKEDYYLLDNVRLAVGAPDTRNKLLMEGKFVTSGINFDVNSDKIKPDSYGILKEVANVLKENEAVKIKITGHTDSDGDDANNMELSKKRAVSVKNALTNEFQISSARIETDGKGESMPVSKNDTPEGKAQNRRVEFVKNG